MLTENQWRACAYEITPVTRRNARAFYNLIQEQAAAHGHGTASSEEERARAAAQLYSDIGERGLCEAFLVTDRAAGGPVTAVTYFNAWGPSGPALYLEDIVTTAGQQRKGHGAFAMAALAQMACQRGLNAIRWECASRKYGAHAFYDRLGSCRLDGRQTWRRTADIGFFEPSKTEVLRFGKGSGQVPGLGVALLEGTIAEGEGHAYFYRSYSTFRNVAGLHVERIEAARPTEETARLLLEGLGASHGKFWSGQYDVTVSTEQQSWMEPALRKLNFEPLSYDGDLMVARELNGESLNILARAPGRDLVRPMQQMVSMSSTPTKHHQLTGA